MLYAFRAVNQAGSITSGEREAGSERELADALRRESLLLLDAEAEGRKKQRRALAEFFVSPFGHVPLTERMIFARNLAVMIGAGLPLTRSLEALEVQSKNVRFREILAAIRAAIIGGATFADGAKPYENVFGTLFLHMVEAGEISGKLETVLKVLARQMKRDHDLRSKVRGAMFYPVIVVTALVGIGFLMLFTVVPTLTKTFAELNIPLPLTTRIVIGSSQFLLNHFGIVLGALAGLAVLAIRVFRTSSGRRFFDTTILRVPVFGGLVQKLNSARFARTLSSLISSGVPIVRALEVTADVLGNSHFRDTVRGAVGSIQRGTALSEVLKGRPDLFPPMVTQMLQVGEETGTTDRMLLRLALFYEEEVTQMTKNLASIIEPLLMIVIGAIVGFFAVAMIQPIYGGLGNL